MAFFMSARVSRSHWSVIQSCTASLVTQASVPWENPHVNYDLCTWMNQSSSAELKSFEVLMAWRKDTKTFCGMVCHDFLDIGFVRVKSFGGNIPLFSNLSMVMVPYVWILCSVWGSLSHIHALSLALQNRNYYCGNENEPSEHPVLHKVATKTTAILTWWLRASLWLALRDFPTPLTICNPVSHSP